MERDYSVHKGTTNERSYYQLCAMLDIPIASGELKSIGVANGLQYHEFRITVDGSVLVDERLAGTASGNTRCNMGLPIGIRLRSPCSWSQEATFNLLKRSTGSSLRLTRPIRSILDFS